jgi:hypothetical protein
LTGKAIDDNSRGRPASRDALPGLSLLTGVGTTDPRFTGPLAIAACPSLAVQGAAGAQRGLDLAQGERLVRPTMVVR